MKSTPISPSGQFLVMALAALILLIPGCVPKKDRSALLKGIPTEQVTLEATLTKSADLVITVPQGFETRQEGESYDKYYIYDRNDNDITQHGMVIIDITPAERWIIRDTSDFSRSRGSIAGESVTWREAKITSDLGKEIYQREMIQGDLLKDYHSPDGSGALLLHAFVVGSDSLLVERLTASVETITLKPRTNL